MAGSVKPQWLVDHQARLRAHPIRRAALWSLGCFVLLNVVHLVRGEAITASGAADELLRWSLAGVLFYFGMRLWEANRAR